MGLSEPRKRLKIAHDPRNLSWSTSAANTSVGHRLMTSQGWSEGQALGARTPSTGTSTPTTASDDATRLAMSKVGMLYKDDTLGLGAKLKSKDVEGQRTGLDAFQSVLGRLNSKTEEELVKHEKKESERKLEGYARGRWGGMMFVPSGVLVQGEGFKTPQERIEEKRKNVEQLNKHGANPDTEIVTSRLSSEPLPVDEKAEKRRQKEERRRRKEERRLRKAARATRKEERLSKTSRKSSKSLSISAPDEATSSSDQGEATGPNGSSEHTKPSTRPSITISETTKKETPGNGRHVLRGRNIEAKRKAFSDTKGLDAIFMR